jgi:hypothetical protein
MLGKLRMSLSRSPWLTYLKVVVALQYRVKTGPATPLFSNCQFLDLVSWAPISYFSSVIYDLAIFGLTLAKLKSENLNGSPYCRRLYLDSLFYVAVTGAANIMVASVEALPPRFNLLKPNFVPFSTVVTVRFNPLFLARIAGMNTAVRRWPCLNASIST